MFSNRSHELEYLDLGSDQYTNEEYIDCMSKLGKIGVYLGGNRASFNALKTLETCPESILDVGCGAGAFTRLLAHHYPKTKVVGIDISQEAIQTAHQQSDRSLYPNLSFELRTHPSFNEPPNSFDVVIATLLCHHMTDDQIIDFIRKGSRASRKSLIINDLQRHPLAYYSFAAIAPIFFNNRLILHDGLLSIKRGFTKNEWVTYLNVAGIGENQYKISWNWAFRWIVTITP